MAPGGGASYQISPDVAVTTCIQLYSERTQKAILWDSISMLFRLSAPKIGGVITKTFSKGSVTRFFQIMAPPGGGGVLSDFTRRGTNYLHTTLLTTYPISNFVDSNSMVFWIQQPQNKGGPQETIFKKLFYPFFPKNGPPGRERFTRFHQTWHTGVGRKLISLTKTKHK